MALSPKAKKGLWIFAGIGFVWTLWTDPIHAAEWANGVLAFIGHGLDSIKIFFEHLNVP